MSELDVDEQAALLDDALGPADFGEVARSEVMYSAVRALHEQGCEISVAPERAAPPLHRKQTSLASFE